MSQQKNYESLSEIEDANPNVELHFAIEQFSPLKKAKSGISYFDGYVTDGSKQMRLVGFDKLQTKLSSYVETKSSLKAERCQIKRGWNQELEILMNSGTKVCPSPRKIEFSADSLQPDEVASHHLIRVDRWHRFDRRRWIRPDKGNSHFVISCQAGIDGPHTRSYPDE